MLGSGDTATGTSALNSECGGINNTADGEIALFDNQTGHGNTGVGYQTLESNVGGNLNTAVGQDTLAEFIGSDTTAVGDHAGFTYSTGDADTFIGQNADQAVPGLTNATAIGAGAIVGESNALVLGNNAKVGIGTYTPDSELTVAGTIESTSGGIKFPDGSTQTTAGITLQPTGAGQFVRSSGPGQWTASALQASDLPAGSTNYIQNGTALQQGSSFNISGTGSIGGSLTVGPGISSVGGPLGVGNQTPHSLLQVGRPSTDYAAFFQPPTVLSPAPPPVATCNTTTFVGRVVLEFNPINKKTILWACSAAGHWANLGEG
jgi:hypothetical protein